MNVTDNRLYDKNFRKELLKDPRQAIEKEIGSSLSNVEYKVHRSTKDTTYIVFPNENFLNQQLDNISAAATSGTVGSIGTLSSSGTASGTVSTVASLGSVGTLGSNG